MLLRQRSQHQLYRRYSLSLQRRLFITEGTITEGTITEGTITEGTITEGTITEGTITEGEGTITGG